MSSQLFKDLMESLAEVAEMRGKPDLAKNILNAKDNFDKIENESLTEDSSHWLVIKTSGGRSKDGFISNISVEATDVDLSSISYSVPFSTWGPNNQAVVQRYKGDILGEYTSKEDAIEKANEIVSKYPSYRLFGTNAESLTEKLVKKGSKWQAQSEKGRNFGTYDTKAEAEKRLQQMEMFKHMNEEYKDFEDLTVYELRDLPIGSIIKIRMSDGYGKLVDGVNAYKKIDDDEFIVLDDNGLEEPGFKHLDAIDVYYGIANLEVGEYEVIGPNDINEAVDLYEPLDDEPTFEEYLMNEWGMTLDEVEVEPEVEDYYKEQYNNYLDHLYDLMPEIEPKSAEREVTFDDTEPEYTEFDNMRDTFGVEKDMSDEEVKKRFLAKCKEWDFDDAEEAAEDFFVTWKAMKNEPLEESEEDEESFNCPHCGTELDWIGSQGNVEEYECPNCEEYFYVTKANKIISADELNDDTFYGESLDESVFSEVNQVNNDYKLLDKLKDLPDYKNSDEWKRISKEYNVDDIDEARREIIKDLKWLQFELDNNMW